LRSVERQLDFSDAGRAVSRFLANRNRRLFSMSTENALVTLLREGLSVNEESVDSKRDLEEALRDACNGFIDHVSTSLAEEVFNLLAKLNSSTPESLKSDSFFDASKVKEILAKTLEDFDLKAKQVLNKMGLYLENPTTQSILLKPVSKKVLKGLEEVKKGIIGMTNEDNGWNESIRAEILQIMIDLEKVVKKTGRAAK
jgi:nucleotidyltransferase/DNA polymerase involved in DNA repair